MIHQCNINCKTMEQGMSESLGIPDPGKWLPFIFDIGMVEAAKLTTDDEDDPLFNCTSIFTMNGDVYIIDTPFKKFSKIFVEYYKPE